MRDMGIVRGSKEAAVPLVIGKDTVYVHTDIEEIEEEFDDEKYTTWQYHEIQYTLQEYILMQAEEQKKLKSNLINAQNSLIKKRRNTPSFS